MNPITNISKDNSMSKILFILKKREITSEEDTALSTEIRPYFKYCLSSGLRNSASFVSEMLVENGIESKLVEVIDNNCIDREVNLYKPTHVIIEAFWVVPEKFDILQKLHPSVKWIVRNHSEIPFLANEGIATDWILKYLSYDNVYVAPNSTRCFDDTFKMAKSAYGEKVAKKKVLYLPNFYRIKEEFAKRKGLNDRVINVGCFGAIRPLKNHLIQAIAAISYAERNGLSLRFHINVARLEDKGNTVLNSLRGLFSNLDPKKFELVEHGWLSHDDFLKLVATMDIGLQVSFTESFNIVTADFVSKGIPVVTSKEIFWLPDHFYALETSAEDIASRMEKVLFGHKFFRKSKMALNALKKYNKDAVKVWVSTFK